MIQFNNKEQALEYLDTQDCYLSNPREIIGGGITTLPSGIVLVVGELKTN